MNYPYEGGCRDDDDLTDEELKAMPVHLFHLYRLWVDIPSVSWIEFQGMLYSWMQEYGYRFLGDKSREGLPSNGDEA
jgi:hypothetical protein